jgi:uncharacterized delta-60 repeat protein
MLSAADDAAGRTVVREFHDTVAGFRIDYREYSYGGSATTSGSLWVYGPDTDDEVEISRNASLDNAIDFDFNGTSHTIDFDTLARGTPWGISTGGGDDRLRITFKQGDPFSGFQVSGGDGDDELINGDTGATLRGQAGDDVLRGGAGGDYLEGGEGLDKLYGGPGNDYLSVGTRSSLPGPGVPYAGPYLEAEDGEVYDGGPGDDMFQQPPAPAVALPDGGEAPAPADPEGAPPRSEPYPQAPSIADGTPTAALALDVAFDGDGRLTRDFGWLDRARTIEPLPGGKFLVGGFAYIPQEEHPELHDAAGFLMKVNPDGTLDRSFGDDGVVVSKLFDGGDGVTDIALQADGKILAAGAGRLGFDEGRVEVAAFRSSDLGVVRFNADGSLDTAFGDGGRGLVDFHLGNDTGASVAVAPDGKIVLAGSAGTPLMTDPTVRDMSDVGVARFNADGTPDTSFSEDGKQTFDFRLDRYSSSESATVAVAPGGKVMLALTRGGSTRPAPAAPPPTSFVSVTTARPTRISPATAW